MLRQVYVSHAAWLTNEMHPKKHLDDLHESFHVSQLDWTQTQPGGLSAQLDCGARAFDARPAVDNKTGDLVWHHGGITVPYNFSASLEEVTTWCAANPTELVLMTV